MGSGVLRTGMMRMGSRRTCSGSRAVRTACSAHGDGRHGKGVQLSLSRLEEHRASGAEDQPRPAYRLPRAADGVPRRPPSSPAPPPHAPRRRPPREAATPRRVPGEGPPPKYWKSVRGGSNRINRKAYCDWVVHGRGEVKIQLSLLAKATQLIRSNTIEDRTNRKKQTTKVVGAFPRVSVHERQVLHARVRGSG